MDNSQTTANRRLRQPKALFVLAAVQMWECFSFYGMRALMVLYMMHKLGFSDAKAYAIFALYGSLVEFGGVLGGRLADKIFGLRKCISMGGWLIALGHIILAIDLEYGFFTGLAFIIMGSGLFSTNISALLGQFYPPEDERREAGYTLLYTGINVGGFLASIVCGFIGETYGWHYGFGLAACGMIVGNLFLLSFGSFLENKGHLANPDPLSLALWAKGGLLVTPFIIAFLLVNSSLFINIMPIICVGWAGWFALQMARSGDFSKFDLMRLGIFLTGFAIFFAAEEQTGSTLIVLSERYAIGDLGGFITSSSLLSLNPLTIILCGGIVARLGRRSSPHSYTKRIAGSLLASSAAFVLLAGICRMSHAEVPLIAIAGIIIAISLAELFLAPAMYAYCSEIAPSKWQGVTMGMIPLGYALGSLLNGFFNIEFVSGEQEGLAHYANGFAFSAFLLAFSALVVVLGLLWIAKVERKIQWQL